MRKQGGGDDRVTGKSGWQFWIDRGGTFTDVVARRPDGRLHARKLLSDNPDRYDDAAIAGIDEILAEAGFDRGDYESVEAVKMGTTVATNALLERHGEPTVLVITRGFADALRIGYQQRPRLFDRRILLPESLYTRVVEAAERVDRDGAVLTPLDEAALRRDLEKAFQEGFRSCAIVFMHGYRHHDHELRAARLASDAGFSQVSASCNVGALAKLVARGDTTVADAYLSPVLRRYVDRVAATLGDTRLLFMQSNGGLAEAAHFRGRDSVLSGPAAGVVGMVETALQAGHKRLIGFDMGGTSTDVSLYDGKFERTLDSIVAGVRIQAPMMKIHTVAAGGGSVVQLVDGRLQVGPESAGADPGPVCYRREGPLTVTDANLRLGRIQADFFPAVFGPNGDLPLDAPAVNTAFERLASRVAEETDRCLGAEELAEGCLRIAVERMAQAIKQISIQRGYDVAGFTLCCFGGAAGQHACDVADALGMRNVLIHPLAGVLSAYGMGLASLRHLLHEAVEEPLDDDAIAGAGRRFEVLEKRATRALEAQGAARDSVTHRRRLLVRYAGTDTPLEVPFGMAREVAETFDSAHRSQFGFAEDRDRIVEAVALESVAPGGPSDSSLETPRGGGAPEPRVIRPVFADGRWRETPVYARETLGPGALVEGPALIVEHNATTVLKKGWQLACDELGIMTLTRREARESRDRNTTRVDPILLEVFNNLFMHIAEQMGVVLEKTAHSVNIKERLDFSCALFDAGGGLVANAPHMPVHLGSMGDSVRQVIRIFAGRMAPGDSFVLNAPYGGGTHLPDVTVVSPCYVDESDEPLFYVASRAHHADIGGITPGSMPPDSRNIDQEGILIECARLVRKGRFLEEKMRELLSAGDHPARNPDRNIADLRAQLAANARGREEVARMVAQFGRGTVCAYMGHVQDNAEEAVRRAIGNLAGGRFVYPMDDGLEIAVSVDVDETTRSVRIDFTGTSPQSETNFNAPLSVCRAAVLYVFRTLVDHDIPMNEGCLRPIELVVPEKTLLNPLPPAAVVAGNVETSQCIVDCLYGALGVLAASQGTMNNLTFGNDTYQYYETICGGAGAGPGFDGASAVHTHMTNSRLTDPEVLEWRYPVLLRRFSIRRGSGGPGRFRGGDGAVREIEFREPMSAAILSGHRRVPPFGLAGGGPGAVGHNRLIGADGSRTELGATAAFQVKGGDVLMVETPGGGGYGERTDKEETQRDEQ
ncbi:MAG: hydantoinase B/oxoprolinase family protein [Gammaproteobacteria bacterium]|jgi:5-oxoprolinase (ATP-hydrolysing)